MTERTGRWRRERLARSTLYLCCDTRRDRGDLDAFLDAVLVGGVDIVQLRDKEASPAELIAAAARFRAAALRHGALFILNDDPALAAEVGADGVHVGQDDPHPDEARRVLGADGLIGRSTHSARQVDQALREDCDCFTVGPVHATPTKEGRPGIGIEPVRHAARTAGRHPWFVSGGMSTETAPAVLGAGGRGLVVVRALTEAEDPARAAQALARLLSP